MLDRKERWIKHGVKAAIFVKGEKYCLTIIKKR